MIDFQVGKSVAPAAKATPIAVSLIDKNRIFFETLHLRREKKTEAPKTTIKRGSKEQSLFYLYKANLYKIDYTFIIK